MSTSHEGRAAELLYSERSRRRSTYPQSSKSSYHYKRRGTHSQLHQTGRIRGRTSPGASCRGTSQVPHRAHSSQPSPAGGAASLSLIVPATPHSFPERSRQTSTSLLHTPHRLHLPFIEMAIALDRPRGYLWIRHYHRDPPRRGRSWLWATTWTRGLPGQEAFWLVWACEARRSCGSWAGRFAHDAILGRIPPPVSPSRSPSPVCGEGVILCGTLSDPRAASRSTEDCSHVSCACGRAIEETALPDADDAMRPVSTHR
ncbi:hypothetical protein OH77DRAFT_223113 [Trametes cingulata]|nr:hypothetical protein OH77DRAFT_223113 [Trametes cingulata]